MAKTGKPATGQVSSQYRRTTATTVAGLCYLAVIGGGLFAEGTVRSSLIVPGDAVATAKAILDGERLWRLGIAVHLLYLLPGLTMKVIVSGLFRDAEPTLSRLALVFGASAVTIEAMALVFLFVPLATPAIGPGHGALADAPSLVYLATRLFTVGFAFSLLLFAGFCAAVGWLIMRSRLLPRPIGVMMVLAGLCYVVNTMALILAPDLAQAINPGILPSDRRGGVLAGALAALEGGRHRLGVISRRPSILLGPAKALYTSGRKRGVRSVLGRSSRVESEHRGSGVQALQSDALLLLGRGSPARALDVPGHRVHPALLLGRSRRSPGVGRHDPDRAARVRCRDRSAHGSGQRPDPIALRSSSAVGRGIRPDSHARGLPALHAARRSGRLAPARLGNGALDRDDDADHSLLRLGRRAELRLSRALAR